MITKWSLILSAIFACSGWGCSSGAEHKNSQRFIKSGGFAADPLTYTAVSRTLLTARDYFISYSPSSGRFAVIDAGDFTEVWGEYLAADIPFVFNLPGYEGGGFVEDGSFTVVVREGARTFAAAGIDRGSWNRARSVIAVAGYEPATRTVKYVRYRGDNNWEEGAIDAFPGATGVSSARVVVSDNGKVLFVVDPASGSYSVIADKNAAYELQVSCPFTTAASLAGAVIDEASSQALVAAGNKIVRIDVSPGAACQSPDAWPVLATGVRSFSDIGLLDQDRIYATERDDPDNPATQPSAAQIHVLTRSNGSVAPTRSFSAACTEPTSVNPFGDGGTVVTCANRVSGYVQDVSLNFFSGADALLLTRSISFDRMAGIVFNAQSQEFYEIFDSAAGEVRITNTETGVSRGVSGIYLDGILNKL